MRLVYDRVAATSVIWPNIVARQVCTLVYVVTKNMTYMSIRPRSSGPYLYNNICLVIGFCLVLSYAIGIIALILYGDYELQEIGMVMIVCRVRGHIT